MSEIGSMSVKELRAYIASAGLGYEDCFEISDLRQRATEAAARLKTQAPRPSAAAGGAIATERRTYFGYDCTLMGSREVLAGTQTPGLIVVFLHGLGASASDFASFPTMLPVKEAIGGVLWVLPQAPVGAMMMPAWWTIDVMQWMGAMRNGADAIARLIRDVPPGLPECRSKMCRLIEEVCHSANDCPTSRVVLGGFSQGAMTSLDTALSMAAESRVGGVISVSGAPIVVDEWAKKLHAHKGLPVLVTHGRADGTLPFQACGWLEELLKHNGAQVSTSIHGGGHELGGPAVVAAILAFLDAVAKKGAA